MPTPHPMTLTQGWHPASASVPIPREDDTQPTPELNGRAASGTGQERPADEQLVLGALVRLGKRPLSLRKCDRHSNMRG